MAGYLSTTAIRLASAFGFAGVLGCATANAMPQNPASENSHDGQTLAQRYNELGPLVKPALIENAARDCVFLDKQDETTNSVSRRTAEILEIMSRIAPGRHIVSRLKAEKVAFCFGTPEAPTSDTSTPKEAYYITGGKVIVFDKLALLSSQVTYGFHEDQHGMQDFADMMRIMKGLNMNDKFALEIDMERDAETMRILFSWMLSRKEFATTVYRDALNNLLRDTESRPDVQKAVKRLNELYKTNPECIENGVAAGEINRILDQEGIVLKLYLEDVTKKQAGWIVTNISRALAKTAYETPEFSIDMVAEDTENTARDMNLSNKKGFPSWVAKNVVKVARTIPAEFVRKNPDATPKNVEALAEKINRELSSFRTSLGTEMIEARNKGIADDALRASVRAHSEIGKIHYMQDYRRFMF